MLCYNCYWYKFKIFGCKQKNNWNWIPLKSTYLRPNMVFTPKISSRDTKTWKNLGFWGLSPKSPIQKSCSTSPHLSTGLWRVTALAVCLEHFFPLITSSIEVCLTQSATKIIWYSEKYFRIVFDTQLLSCRFSRMQT